MAKQNYQKRTGNYNTKDYIGEIYSSNKCGDFKILREIIPVGYTQRTRLFEIEFINTGYRNIVCRESIYSGM